MGAPRRHRSPGPNWGRRRTRTRVKKQRRSLWQAWVRS
jgi:hypothetical protein